MATTKEVYGENKKEIKRQLKMLETALIQHSDEFKTKSTNWGFVGDLAYIKKELSELNVFLKSNKEIKK